MNMKRIIPFVMIVLLTLAAVNPAFATDLNADSQASINFGAGELKLIEAPSFAMGDHPVPTGPNQVYNMSATGSVSGKLMISDSKRASLFSVSAKMSSFDENGGSHSFTAELNLEAGTPSVSTAVANYIDKVTTTDQTISTASSGQLLSFVSGTLLADLALTDYMVNWAKPQVTLKITDPNWSTIQQNALYESVVTWTIAAP